MRIALLHAYSAENSGDGLLVRHSLDLLRHAFGDDISITLFATYPDSFVGLGVEVVPTKPGLRGYDRSYRRMLRSGLCEFDLLVGVGGGYLRAPGGIRSIRGALVNFPQVKAAARSRVPTAYLPQSVGPLRGRVGAAYRQQLAGLDVLFLRDNRSVAEVGLSTAARVPDLAALFMDSRLPQSDLLQDDVPVFNARRFRGEVLVQPVRALRRRFEVVDGLVQSSVSNNDDGPSVEALQPRLRLDKNLFYSVGVTPRVVVAMRLHCALQAINAGHYVVHLSYERKGFGAFEDLSLREFVFNVADLDVDNVELMIRRLQSDVGTRRRYDALIAAGHGSLRVARDGLVEALRKAAE